MEEIWPDEKLRAQYILKNPITRVIQCAPVYSENEVTLRFPVFPDQEDSVTVLKGVYGKPW